jgi:uracil-DNA glycosylase family 4
MSAAEGLERIAGEVVVCERCPLHESRKHAVPGEGPADASVVIVGEGPGGSEDEQGRPFVGSAGRNLDGLLSHAGLKREDVFITNVVKCRPPGNRRPRRGELDACHPYLRRQLETINPRLIVLLGDTALKEFFPDATLGALHGKVTRRGEQEFFATYHPASMIYNQSLGATLEEDFAKLGEEVRSRSG